MDLSSLSVIVTAPPSHQASIGPPIAVAARLWLEEPTDEGTRGPASRVGKQQRCSLGRTRKESLPDGPPRPAWAGACPGVAARKREICGVGSWLHRPVAAEFCVSDSLRVRLDPR